jgi:hypothetical protein
MIHAHKPIYYAGGIALLALSFLGCASPNAVARTTEPIPFEQLDRGDRAQHVRRLQKLPFIVHFRAGDRVPVDLAVHSRLFDVPDQTQLVTVKRDFYLLFRKGGAPLLSEDGVDFERRARNSFSFGFDLQKDEPTRVRIEIGVRAQPEAAE